MFGLVKKEDQNTAVATRRGAGGAGRSVTMVETMENLSDAAGQFSTATRNFAESLKVSSQRSLIRSHEKLQDTVRNSTLSDSMLREILGPDFERYKDW